MSNVGGLRNWRGHPIPLLLGFRMKEGVTDGIVVASILVTRHGSVAVMGPIRYCG